MQNGEIAIRRADDLKLILAKQYRHQINNYFGNEKQSLKFLSSVMSSVQRMPKLLECDPVSLVNSFLIMAELELMPSGVSGEAYVLPYNGKHGLEAQFQLGYQGLVTLFYRAGCKSINSEIVYENDKFDYTNCRVNHSPDVFSENRGEPIGAYVIVITQQGGEVHKVMKKNDILAIGEKFSKSYFKYDYKAKRKTEELGEYTPWNPDNDPELWMWKKTVLKQAAKLVPKNETIFKAIAADNKDSNIEERMAKARAESEGLKMGNLIPKGNDDGEDQEEGAAGDGSAEGFEGAGEER